MAKIVLISCTKTKRSYRCKAKKMYDLSVLFRRSWEYADLQKPKPDKIYILSAKYYLLEPEKIIDPYDVTLCYVSKKERFKNPTLKILNNVERRNWYTEVINQLKLVSDLEKDDFVFLAGKCYTQGLITHILNNNAKEPLEGKNYGKRTAWLKKEIEKLKGKQ